MKKSHLTLAWLAVSVSCLIAGTAALPEAEPGLVFDASAQGGDTFPRWTIVGAWRVAHPHWNDVLTLYADGTAKTTEQGTTAKWTLSAEGGTPMLVLRWDAYGSESLTMVGPDHFRGQAGPGSFIDMRRGQQDTAAGGAEVKTE